jgi:hypothetical protein
VFVVIWWKADVMEKKPDFRKADALKTRIGHGDGVANFFFRFFATEESKKSKKFAILKKKMRFWNEFDVFGTNF